MVNAIFQNLYRAQIDYALANAESIKGLDQKLVIGRLREIFLDDLLRPLVPPTFIIRTGIVMDHVGDKTGEIDLIVANRSTVPLLSLGERDGIFPVESVIYAIEVKSVLKKEHIDETFDKFRRLQNLTWLCSGEVSPELRRFIDYKLQTPQPNYENPEYCYGPNDMRARTILFAYRSEINIANFLEKIDEENRTNIAPLIQVICVPSKGYWRWTRAGGWIFVPPDREKNETLMFMAGLSNTMYSSQFSSIGARFGQYIA